MTDQSHQCVIIGIAGASASGKSLIASTLYRELREQVGDEHIGVIPEDCYYKDQSHLSMEERVKTNYDHPSAMDHSLLLEHLQALKRGSAIDLPVYSYVEHTRMKETVTVQYQKTVRPMFLQFIEPSKQYADIIVPRGGKNRIAIDILKAKISQFFE